MSDNKIGSQEVITKNTIFPLENKLHLFVM